jgi:S-adenosyl-L-methionine hydrolase (adenosine-forming)
MTLRYDTITFASDYGLRDEFVGVVHSVIRSIAPQVGVIDLTHDIAPYDVRAGGLTLARSAPYLCPGVVLAIVDPGVGTPRRGIAVEVGDGASVLIGPDNGVLAPAVAMCGGATRAVALTNPEYQLEAPGPTFAGRDIFAPAAAHLCRGVPLERLGESVDPVTLRPGLIPVAHPDGDELAAEVLWVDRYGNAQLNIDPDDLSSLGPSDELTAVRLRFGDETRAARIVETFAEVGPNDIGLVVDSYGLLAIVVDQQSAADRLGLGAGTAVHLSAFGDDDRGTPFGATTPVTLGTRRPNPES